MFTLGLLLSANFRTAYRLALLFSVFLFSLCNNPLKQKKITSSEKLLINHNVQVKKG